LDNTEGHQLSALVRYGVSDTLIGLLAAVAESTGAHGRKYGEKTVQELHRLILCRNQGMALWWLANLLAAVQATQTSTAGQSPCIQFFWVDENLTPSRIRCAFADSTTDSPKVICAEQLQITYDDGEFSLGLSKLPLLSALLELVVAIVPDFWQQLAALDVTRASAVSSFASHLQSEVNDYLSNHMQLQQQQRKARTILQWLHLNNLEIDDQSVLEFWCFAQQEKLPDFKQFNTVAESFVDLLAVLEEGGTNIAVSQALSMGMDASIGEIDPERLESAVLELRSDLTPLAKLADVPLSSIKFLTDKDRRQLSVLDTAGMGKHNLHLTLARMAVFGGAQMSISQHARKGRHDLIPDLVRCRDVPTYQDHIDSLRLLANKMYKTRLCALHVLLQLEHEESAPILVGELPEDARAQLASRLSEVSLSAGDTVSYVLAKRDELALQIPALNALLREAKAAYKSINREGFQQLPSKDMGSAYVQGIESLAAIAGATDLYVNALDQVIEKLGGSMALHAAELEIYRNSFKTLYGEWL